MPSPCPASPPALAALKGAVRRIEGMGRPAVPVVSTGLPPLDTALPGGGLRRDGLHEIVAASGDAVAAQGFVATLAAGLEGRVLWCSPVAELYGPGLARLGLAPERLVLARAWRPSDLLWAMEEGLRMSGLAAVVGEAEALDLTQSRRLQLAAEASATPAFMLTQDGAAGTTAAVTRWRVAAAPSGPQFGRDERDFGLRRARWQVTLLRCRGAVPAGEDFGTWLIEEGAPAAPAVAVPARPLPAKDHPQVISIPSLRAKRSNPEPEARTSGLLRFARNDGRNLRSSASSAAHHPGSADRTMAG